MEGKIMEWISSHWTAIAGSVVALLGGWYVPIVRKIYVLAFKSMLSEAVLKKVFLQVAESLAKSTKNDIDDTIVAEIKNRI